MTDIILHHYPQSPVAEKVRVVLGIKHLDWRSVEVPRLPPKPKLMPLTGGYRRTPVMQIGADVYCDSACIIRALERLHPQPTLYPGGADGMVWAVSRWTDLHFFRSAIAVVLGSQAEKLPAEFAADRGRLYFGPAFDLAALAADLPHELAQVRAQLAWIDDRLSGGRRYLLGDAPGLPDALTYYLVWFLRGRYAGGPGLLARFPHLCAWESRVKAIGHGRSENMTEDEALAAARGAAPSACAVDEDDPRQLRAGMRVSVVPCEDGGDPPVEGELVGLDRYEIVLNRHDPDVDTVAVHFPQVGYRVTVLQPV